MSNFNLDCGHTVDGHGIVWITVEGMKAFRIWQKYYGKKVVPYILKKGGGFKEEYLCSEKASEKECGGTICTDCLSNWSVYI